MSGVQPAATRLVGLLRRWVEARRRDSTGQPGCRARGAARSRLRPFAIVVLLESFMLVAGAAAPAGASERGKHMTFTISSPSFAPDGEIPRRHTADGKDVSPPLAWTGAPVGTKSLALIVDDPDAPDPAAPKTVWVHWVLYDIIPASATGLAEGVIATALPKGTLAGLNDWKQPGWRGPAPPIGRHRYFFKLYALDIVLPDLRRPTKAQLEKAMRGHALGEAQVVGTYARP